MKRPPRIARWILSITNRKKNREIVLGDFEEFYHETYSERGAAYANIWFFLQAIKSIPRFLITTTLRGMEMINNHIKFAIRNILKTKGYSSLNIFGLAFGIACCLLISVYIMFECSYDNFHHDEERIFRIAQQFENPNGVRTTSLSGAPLGPTLKDNFPHVEYYARIIRVSSGLIKNKNESYYENKRFYADNDLFKILSIPFLRGNPNTALVKPSTVVITESISKKYFGNENSLGRSISINGNKFEITGITADPKPNSHFHFNILMSLRSLEVGSNYPFQYWFFCNFHTYIKLTPNTDVNEFTNMIDLVINPYYKDELDVGESLSFIMQPVPDIHLYSQLEDELEPSGNPTTLIIFAFLSILILIIACINFINLTTAKSALRGKEIGIRKVIGAARINLVFQFLSEAFVMTLMAIIVSIFIIALSLPLFNSIAGTRLVLNDFLNAEFAAALLILILFVTFIAGGYPAFILSSFQPIDALKQNAAQRGSGSLLRNILVVGQYSISILLIISSMIIYSQINFMKNKNMGFDKEQKLILPIRERIGDKYEMIKNEFLKNPAFTEASVSSTVPGREITGLWTTNIEGRSDQPGINMNHYYIDTDFLNHYKIPIIEGRSFVKEISSDRFNSYLINEAAAKALGWSKPADAVGKKIISVDSAHTIIGVIKDFNHLGLQYVVQPMILAWEPANYRCLTLSTNVSNMQNTLSYAEDKWEELFPGIPFRYFFLDQNFEKLYQAENNFGQLISTFTLLAFMIATLGLLGLSSFMTERRKKEIGVRKVLGASIPAMVILLSKEFIKLVLLANIISWPISYYLMNGWLQDFAYRSQINIWLFIAAGLSTFLLAIGTVSYQTIKASIANPINSIKYE